jgi:hypothetical protein
MIPKYDILTKKCLYLNITGSGNWFVETIGGHVKEYNAGNGFTNFCLECCEHRQLLYSTDTSKQRATASVGVGVTGEDRGLDGWREQIRMVTGSC